MEEFSEKLKKNHKLFTDLTLIITDCYEDQIVMQVHKIILYNKCIYFEKLLTYEKEVGHSIITIETPHAKFSQAIIMEFYGIGKNAPENWMDLIDMIKCYDYFGLEINIKLPEKFNLPKESIQPILEILYLINYDTRNNKFIGKISKFLPRDCDLSNYDNNFVNKIRLFINPCVHNLEYDDDMLESPFLLPYIWNCRDKKIKLDNNKK